jgi:competence protein ComEA
MEEQNLVKNEGQAGELELEASTPVPEEVDANPLIDLNTATINELQQLPGIGRVLAQRIVDLRADVQRFEDPAEILAVRGISETMYGRMAGRLAVEPATAQRDGELWPEDVPVMPMEEWPEAGIPEAELKEGGEPEELAPEEPERTEPEVRRLPIDKEPPLVQVVSGPAGWGRMLLIGLLSAIGGALLALVFLFILNGTLDFQAATQRTVQGEVARFEGEVHSLRAELQQVEDQLGTLGDVAARLDTAQVSIDELGGEIKTIQSRLESMSDEAGTLRQEYTNLREDVDGMAGLVSGLGQQVGEIEAQLSALSRQMAAMGESVERSDLFMNGLRDMLNRLLGGQRPTPTPSAAVTITPQATTTPSGQ